MWESKTIELFYYDQKVIDCRQLYIICLIGLTNLQMLTKNEKCSSYVKNEQTVLVGFQQLFMDF